MLKQICRIELFKQNILQDGDGPEQEQDNNVVQVQILNPI